jgi:hypothetical protein
MREIHIANSKKRDSFVGFEAKPTRAKIFYKTKDGKTRSNIKLIKGTQSTTQDALLEEYQNSDSLIEAMLQGDPEIDYELFGAKLSSTSKVYVDQDGELVFSVDIYEVTKDTKGIEQSRKIYKASSSNISLDELPIRWSGKFINRQEAIKKFVFSRHYQIHHTDGLTYDFLYDMAKELSEKNSLMFVGGGKKGNEPIVLSNGSKPYRAFLEGRVDGEKYILILHLTNLELKEFTKS